MTNQNASRRPGFTITELLIVIGIIGILAGLAIYFVPSFNTSAKSARGAADLQQWLNAARQRSIRDQAPRGLRILFDPVTGIATKCQFLEQPDDFGAGRYFDSSTNPAKWLNLQLRPDPNGGGTNIVWLASSNGNSAFNFGKRDPFLNRFPGADGIHFTEDDPPVQVGDYLQVGSAGLAHRIVDSKERVPKSNVFDMLVLASNLAQPIGTFVADFRITRQPRVVGDETFDLPRSIVVDGNTNVTYASTLNFMEALPADPITGNLDVMFSPTGAVMPGKTSKGRIYLWVRSTEYPGLFDGEPTLIVVHINSGLVAAHAVDVGNVSNPYDLTPLPW